jgi:hypothetical protein
LPQGEDQPCVAEYAYSAKEEHRKNEEHGDEDNEELAIGPPVVRQVVAMVVEGIGNWEWK